MKFLLFILLLLAAGCSYFHIGQSITEQVKGGSLIPDSANRIFIRPFSDGASGAGFKNEFSYRLKRTINLDGRLAVIDSEQDSDLVLDATVVHYAEENVKFDSSGRAVMCRISITVRVTVFETATARVIVKDKETDLFTVYNPDSSLMDEVYRELADRASAAVLSIILTGWAVDGKVPGGRGI